VNTEFDASGRAANVVTTRVAPLVHPIELALIKLLVRQFAFTMK